MPNTVSVTAGSAIVAGDVTSFVGAAGDLFILNGLACPIASVESTSHLTLQFPWPGGTLAGQSRWVLRNDGPHWSSTVTLNQQLAAIIPTIEAIAEGTLAADGAVPMTGNLRLGGHRVTGLSAPIDPTDALSEAAADARYAAPLGFTPLNSAGGTSTGNQRVQTNSYPAWILRWPGVREVGWRIGENGYLQFWDLTGGTVPLQFGPGGDISSAQFGDLNARIESRASAYAENARASATGVANTAQATANAAQGAANAAQGTANGAANSAAGAQASANAAYGYAAGADANANNRVSRYGDTMSGALEILSPGVQHVLHFPGVKRAYWYIGGDGILRYQDQGGTVHFQVGGSGEIYTQQMGDLATRIENRAAAFADAAYNNANGYSNASFVRAIRQTSYAELYMNGGWTFAYDGWVMTGIYRSNDGFAQYMAIRAMQYLVNGGWYTGSIS